MDFFSTCFLALSLSADAFAVSVSKGAARPPVRLRDAMKIAAVFGLAEGAMPVLGWLMGQAASSFIQSVDHWVAFAILGAIGAKMVYEGFAASQAEIEEAECESFLCLFATSIGTSIDSLAVGVSLAFVEAPLLASAATIGLSSFSMVTIGLMAGRAIGARLGRRAEILGGLGLVAIGGKILVEHLGLV